MFFTLLVSKVLKSNVVNRIQPENKYAMPVTFVVSQAIYEVPSSLMIVFLDTSRVVNFLRHNRNKIKKSLH